MRRITLVRAAAVIALASALACDGNGEDGVCEPGATQPCTCAGGANGAQICREDRSGWEACDCGGDTDVDTDADTDADSDTDSCDNECSQIGQTRCADAPDNGVLFCADHDADPCLEWGRYSPCSTGDTCQDGVCLGTCENECQDAGEQRCADAPDNGVLTCGDHDDDDCLEWGDLSPCEGGQICSAAACRDQCQDDCPALGDRRCADAPDSGVLFCGDYDGNGCREWGGFQACEAGQTCSDGVCQGGQCSDECPGDGERDCDGDVVIVCGNHDADPCLEWSEVEACGRHEECDHGECCTEEGEDCEFSTDDIQGACCDDFHCCPVFKFCVPDFW